MFQVVVRAARALAFAGCLLALCGLSAYVSFSLFVRRGVLTVPDTVGLPLAEAQLLLEAEELRPHWREEADRFDESMPAGLVLEVEPPVGSRVKKGSRVAVVLSRGKQRAEVPDVRQQALPAAQLNLASQGLTAGRRLQVFSTVGRPGTVVGQHPLPGSLVDQTTAVDLLVSLGNTSEVFVMPDLVDRSDDAVREFFSRHGLRVGNVRYEPYEGVPPGTVLRQYPLPGHPVRRDDVISIVVAGTTT